jgi:glycerol-3-phosphate acyltransferase PlsY
MRDVLITIGLLVGAYLVGGVPFSFLVGRVFYGTDIRERGSGNVGATNVYRVLGWKAGLFVAVLDVAKGYVPVALVALWAPDAGDPILIGASLAAVLGHTYTPYLALHGGKGVATAAGALLRLTPWSVAVLFPVFALTLATTRIVSVASLVIAVGYPVTVLVFYSDRPIVVGFSFATAALVVWRHRSNITRLIAGTESAIFGKDRGGPPEDTSNGE